MDQTDVSIRTDQRALLVSKLKRGQLFENSPRVQEAREIWAEACSEASAIAEECREQLQSEFAGAQSEGISVGKEHHRDSQIDSESGEEGEEYVGLIVLAEC